MNLSDILADLSEPAVIEAIEASSLEFWLRYGRGPGCEVHEEPDLLWFTTGVPHPLFNGVMRARLTSKNLSRRVREITAEFRARNLPLEWAVGASTTPRDLGEQLKARGFEHTLDVPAMAIDLTTLHDLARLPRGLSIEPVEDPRDFETYLHVGYRAFEIPDAFFGRLRALEANMARLDGDLARRYLGYADGKPVATSMLLLHAGVAGIYQVGVLPEARNRGIGAAMTLAALRDAADMGYRLGVLQASALGTPVYRHLGFQEYFHIGLYAGPRDPRAQAFDNLQK